MKNSKVTIKEKSGNHGRYRFITTDAITGEVKRTSDWISNKIVNGSGTGINIIANILANITTNPLPITKAKIGTGTTPPTDGDTDLQTSVYTITSVTDASVSGGLVTLSFFIPYSALPNGTYTEFGLFCVNQLFARSIISPSYVKGTNENTTIEYEIQLTN